MPLSIFIPFGVWFALDSTCLGTGVELTQFASRRCVKSWRSSWQWHPQHPWASFSKMGRFCEEFTLHLVTLVHFDMTYDSGVHPAYDPHGSQADEGQEMKHKLLRVIKKYTKHEACVDIGICTYHMQCTFLSSEVAVVFVLQIQSNEWPKHSYIFWFEHVPFKIYPNEIDTGIWSWIIHCPGTINDCGQQHLPVTLQAGSDDHFHVASTAQCWNTGICSPGLWIVISQLTFQPKRRLQALTRSTSCSLPPRKLRFFWRFPGLVQTWRLCKLVTFQPVKVTRQMHNWSSL